MQIDIPDDTVREILAIGGKVDAYLRTAVSIALSEDRIGLVAEASPVSQATQSDGSRSTPKRV